MTLLLSPGEDETLARLVASFGTSKNAAAAAIDLATPRANHHEFVERTTARLLQRDEGLMARLASA